ncbi:unnamed protein product [Notodromas monacha]|uniref:RNA polymerase II-associated protein 1 n=1 Tax=Notodromas monacha TaxID=399045 RepID=A0A7R9GB28_9CRUS|nr:unnamed protein product [Notodromas monacha]CAG0914363.1 unnamed protein product [Notodromas monacha]
MSVSRPKAGDSEEELLKLQHEFLKQNNPPAYTVLQNTSAPLTDTLREPCLPEVPTIDVCGDVVESEAKITKPYHFKAVCHSGFPEVIKIETSGKPSCGKSLFRQRMAQKRGESVKSDIRSTGPTKITRVVETNVVRDSISDEVQTENTAKLAAMSLQEIERQRAEIMSTVDPKTIEFLRSAGRKRTAVKDNHDKASEDVEKFVSEIESSVTQVLPIDLDLARNEFVNMSEVEYEKLKWMTELPEPERKNEGFSARFDFEGNLLLARDMNLPVTKGLHHHGEEPEKPGYSLSELFTLGRSSFSAQKVVALNVMASIIRKAHLGVFDGVFDKNILEQFLDCGGLLLIRFALDDNSEGVLPAAVNALYALLCCETDERCLDRIIGPFELMLQPSMPTKVVLDEHSSKEIQNEGGEKSLKDVELLKLDVVKALIRMNILPRLRYIIMRLKPAPPTVIKVMGILIRIARHSVEASEEILKTEGLLEFISESFIPSTTGGTGKFRSREISVQLKDVYGIPLRHALKLIRVLSSHRRQNAVALFNNTKVMESVICYISFDPSELGLPLQESLLLSLESYWTWTVFLTFELGEEAFLSLYPILVRQLSYYEQKISVNSDVHANTFNYDLGSALLGVFEVAVRLARGRRNRRNDSDSLCITWEHVSSITMSACVLVQKWMTEATRDKMISGRKNSAIRDGVSKVINVYLGSSHFEKIVDEMTKIIRKMKNSVSGCLRDPGNLPTLGTAHWLGDKCGSLELTPALLMDESPIFFLESLIRFLNLALETHLLDGLDFKLTENAYQAFGVLLEAHPAKSSAFSGWFCREETTLMARCVELFTRLDDVEVMIDHKVIFRVALDLMSQLQGGQEGLLLYLMDHNYEIPFSDIRKLGCKSERNIWENCLHQLDSMRAMYSALVNADQDCFHRSISEFYKIQTFCVAKGSEGILPSDWIFLPICVLYANIQNS